MEKKSSHSHKRKQSSKGGKVPPDKKSRQELTIEEILPADNSKNFSSDSIQQIGNTSSCSTSKKTDTVEAKVAEKDKETGQNKDVLDESVPEASVHDTSNENEFKATTSHDQDDKNDETKLETLPSDLPSPDKSPKDSNGNKKKLETKKDEERIPSQSVGTDPINLPAINNDPQTSGSKSPSPPRDKCAYGSSCYRRNKYHRSRFSHPGDADYKQKDTRKECRFGLKCYRKSAQHKKNFKHTGARPKRVKQPQDSEPVDEQSDNSSDEESVDESEYDPSEMDDDSSSDNDEDESEDDDEDTD